jgi:tetratricopeptide (TPR) repeat protein
MSRFTQANKPSFRRVSGPTDEQVLTRHLSDIEVTRLFLGGLEKKTLIWTRYHLESCNYCLRKCEVFFEEPESFPEKLIDGSEVAERALKHLAGFPAFLEDLRDEKQLTEAELDVFLDGICEWCPDAHRQTLIDLGQLLERSDKLEKAVLLYRKAHAMGEECEISCYHLARGIERQVQQAIDTSGDISTDGKARIEEAADLYRRAAKLDPESHELQARLSAVLRILRQDNEAIYRESRAAELYL